MSNQSDLPSLRRRDFVIGGAASTLLGSSACAASGSDPIAFLDFIPAAEHRAIGEGRSHYDCGPALQRAVQQAASSGRILSIPRGIYRLAPSHELTHADRSFPCLAAVRMVSGMRLHGEAGAVLRMIDGYSSDQTPRAMAMFGSSEPVADIEFKDLVLDMNGRANPISPERAAGHYSRAPQAQIFISGGRGETAARGDRVTISDTIFRDANGVSCVVMGQTDDRTARLGRRWLLSKCRFEDNGLDTDDHSSIYAYADDVMATDCTFSNRAGFGPTGVNTAYEVHGSRQTITRCVFRNMMRGIWVANNYSSLTTDTVIKANSFETMIYGVDFFRDRADAEGIRRTIISDNQFRFNDTLIQSSPGLNVKAAVQIASEYAQQDVEITRNTVTKAGHSVTSAFLVITGGARGNERHSAITVTRNEGRGLTFGSFLRTTAEAGIGRVVIVENRWADLSPSSAMAIAAGDAVEHTGRLQPVASLTLDNSTSPAAASRGAQFHAIHINAWIQSLVLKSGNSYGAATKPSLGGAARLDRIEYRKL